LEEISTFPEILKKIPADKASRTFVKNDTASCSELFVAVGLHVFKPTGHSIPKDWDIHHQPFPTSQQTNLNLHCILIS